MGHSRLPPVRVVGLGAPPPARALHGGDPVSRLSWAPIVDQAATIVRSYDTSVTLRQLFYRLVSIQVLPNTVTAYKTLSDRTAEARREGTFPDLVDRGRAIHRESSWDDPADAMAALISQYRTDRTIGQDVSLYLGVEKAGIVNQLTAWFGELGIPILALSGYSSQSYVNDVVADVSRSGRPAVLLYSGDHDPSGEDIDRDFISRTGCWSKVTRIALNAEQVVQYQLPPNPGKSTDSRAAAFVARHGALVQVELDALDPTDLHSLYQAAIGEFWDESAYELALDREREDVALLERAAGVTR